MGGLKKYMPITYAVFVIAGLSAGGFPGMSGFFSKDEIIWSAYASHSPVGKFVWVLAMAGAFFTPFYTFRLIFLTFHGKHRGVHHGDTHGHGSHGEHHIHESPRVMTIPLMFLAVGAVAAGWIGIPPILGGGAHFAEFLKPVVGHPEFHGTHAEEFGVMGLSIALVFIGLGLAAFLYLRKTDLPERIAKKLNGLYTVIYHKYFIDELYNYTIVKPTLWIANKVILAITDGKMIEGVVNGVPGSIGWFSEKLRKVQTGLAQHYGIMMAAGAVFIIALVLLLQ
jgi:NADH-quinone oxidoreductase subunit L